MEAVESWPEVGERVRHARIASGLSQGDLASRVGVDRSALARVESGQRHLSALELFRLSDALKVPLSHFVSRPPAAVTSRRRGLDEDADEVSRRRFRLDAALEAHARDAEWLYRKSFLLSSPTKLPDPSGLAAEESTATQARGLAVTTRRALGLETGPISSMADACGRAGLFVLVLAQEQEGASLLLSAGLGVAVIGGAAEPGRRRATAAHELGHHVLQDEYHSDIGVAASRDEREQRIDAFAAEFLLPSQELVRQWTTDNGTDERARLVRIAADYRVSWSSVLLTAERLELVDRRTARGLHSQAPQRGELLEVVGRVPVEDLHVHETGAQWRQAVLRAWRAGAITAPRAVELLHGAVSENDLPDREPVIGE